MMENSFVDFLLWLYSFIYGLKKSLPTTHNPQQSTFKHFFEVKQPPDLCFWMPTSFPLASIAQRTSQEILESFRSFLHSFDSFSRNTLKKGISFRLEIFKFLEQYFPRYEYEGSGSGSGGEGIGGNVGERTWKRKANQLRTQLSRILSTIIPPSNSSNGSSDSSNSSSSSPTSSSIQSHLHEFHSLCIQASVSRSVEEILEIISRATTILHQRGCSSLSFSPSSTSDQHKDEAKVEEEETLLILQLILLCHLIITLLELSLDFYFTSYSLLLCHLRHWEERSVSRFWYLQEKTPLFWLQYNWQRHHNKQRTHPSLFYFHLHPHPSSSSSSTTFTPTTSVLIPAEASSTSASAPSLVSASPSSPDTKGGLLHPTEELKKKLLTLRSYEKRLAALVGRNVTLLTSLQINPSKLSARDIWTTIIAVSEILRPSPKYAKLTLMFSSWIPSTSTLNLCTHIYSFSSPSSSPLSTSLSSSSSSSCSSCTYLCPCPSSFLFYFFLFFSFLTLPSPFLITPSTFLLFPSQRQG
jgi:hypothetical protein